MTIQFLGAARTVTGSMHLVSANGRHLLLDCGLYQGRRAEAFERNRTFPFDVFTLDAVILSHAHADHAGNLPNLVRNGYRGPIYATPATRDLCNVMLYDSAYLQERDVEIVNRKHRERGLPQVEPIYTTEDVDATIGQIVSLGYRRRSSIARGVELEFFDAGHILGSASPVLEIEERGRTLRLGFTGDLGRKSMPILRDPDHFGDVDVLLSESTYGGRIHEPITGMHARLLDVIRRTVDRGGRIIVPSFSVGRTQELVYALFQLFDAGQLPPIPVYIDSPLAINATEVFKLHPECFDRQTLDYLHRHKDPFGFSRLQYVRTAEESKSLNDISGSFLVIAGSGMCEGGRILHHLANSIEDARNTILIVGFMAEHTLGRRLVERAPEVRILGDIYKLKAEVAILNAFSAHAGQDELLEYIEKVDRRRLKGIHLVHGEPAQAEQLLERLKAAGHAQATMPVHGEKVEYLP